MPVNDQPTEADIEDWHAHYEAIWKNPKAVWRQNDELYFRRFGVWPTAEPAAKRSEYKPSTPTYVVDHASDTQMGFLATVRREPWDQGPQHKIHADASREGLQAVMNDAAMREMVLPWKTAGKYSMLHGYFVLNAPDVDLVNYPEPVEPQRENADKEDDWQARKAYYKYQRRNWNPIRIKALHPARVLLDPFQKDPTVAIRNEKWYVRDLVAQIEKKRTGQHRMHVVDQEVLDRLLSDNKPTDQIDIRDHWTPFWHTVKWPAGAILYSEVNTWNFVPYKHAFSGFGVDPTNLEEVDPSFQTVGLLGPIEDSIKKQAQNASAKHQLLMDYAYSKILFNGDPAELLRQLQHDILGVDPQDIARMPTQEVSEGMFRAGLEQERDIELGSYSQSAGGFRQAGVYTVGQQQITDSRVQQKFASPGVHLQSVGTSVGRDIYQLVDLTGWEIGINGKMLNRTNIEHDYHCEVTFEVLDPVFDFQRREQGRRDWQDGAISTQSYREDYLRVSDVEERRRRLRERVRETQAVTGKLAEAAVADEGLDNVDQFLMDEIRAEMTGAEAPPSNGGGPFQGLRNTVGRVFKPSRQGQNLT